MGAFSNIAKVPELRRRILFTLAILAIYRVGVFITIPGVNRVEMQHVVTKGGSGSFLGMFDMFSGGALQQFSIFTLGIMPYVTSSIVMQLLTVVVSARFNLPRNDRLKAAAVQAGRDDSALRAAFDEGGWIRANLVRVLASLGALGLLAAALTQA